MYGIPCSFNISLVECTNEGDWSITVNGGDVYFMTWDSYYYNFYASELSIVCYTFEIYCIPYVIGWNKCMQFLKQIVTVWKIRPEYPQFSQWSGFTNSAHCYTHLMLIVAKWCWRTYVSDYFISNHFP